MKFIDIDDLIKKAEGMMSIQRFLKSKVRNILENIEKKDHIKSTRKE